MRSLLRLAVVMAVSAMAFPARGQIAFELSTDGWTSHPVAVLIVGSFNDWGTTETPMSAVGTTWRASVKLDDGRHFYKFVWKDGTGKSRWKNDPTNPCLADNGQRGANNFVDVRDGKRVATLEGLEKFEWIAPVAKWVSLAGDFNDWRLGQYAMVRTPGGIWRAWLPVRRPLSYKFIEDGMWKTDLPRNAGEIPDFYGKNNSFRPADTISSPALVNLDIAVAAGDAQVLDAATSYAAAADYGRTIALLRKIAEVNATAAGSTAPLALRALAQEGRVHQRWGRLADAAACWERLATTNANTTDTRSALDRLIRYHLFVKKDFAGARILCSRLVAQASNRKGILEAAIMHTEARYKQQQHAETIAEIGQWFSILPPPDGKDKDYACLYTELLLIKGYCHMALRESDKARESFNLVIQYHPWRDSQGVKLAERSLGILDRSNSPTRSAAEGR